MQRLSSLIRTDIRQKSGQLEHLTHLVQAVLPKEIRQHVEAANIRKNRLVLLTTSPVWATRIRQYSPQIEQMLTEFADTRLHGLSIKCSPRYSSRASRAHRPSRTPPVISHSAAKLISGAANHIADEALSEALHRLASRYRLNSKEK